MEEKYKRKRQNPKEEYDFNFCFLDLFLSDILFT